MSAPQSIVFLAVVILLALGSTMYRYLRSVEILERWARQNHYRLRSRRMRWFALGPGTRPSRRGFGAMFLPSSRGSGPFVFRVLVDDLRFGGSLKADVRCWTSLLGAQEDETEVDWITPLSTPERDGAAGGEARWTEAQLALLKRVEAGETLFRPARRHDPTASAEFDELVEHLMALQRRGFLLFAAPLASVGADAVGQYAAVTGVELTDEGRHALAEARAQSS